MHPILFKIPFLNITVWTYGFMMVVGFLAGLLVVRRLSRYLRTDPQHITNAALYCLLAGLAGARAFYVIHYFEKFAGEPLSVFALWHGGLELLGGVIGAVTVILIYMWYYKLPKRQYFDILAVGLLVALSFGRVGCFFRGCCFGRPTDLPWAVQFPYGKELHSPPYLSQVFADPGRNRPEPYIDLPDEFFTSVGESDTSRLVLKPWDRLTPEQKEMVSSGPYEALPVHPTQLYASAYAALLAFILYLLWRRARKYQKIGKTETLLTKPGSVFALMLILYGFARFINEFFRGDNPFEYAWWTLYKGGTISQNISIYLVIAGLVLLVISHKMPVRGDTARGKPAPK
jgi:phosphatidylglycerol:prolipoprotein diacylglycerol transferase